MADILAGAAALGALVAAVMMVRHAWGIARTGGVGLLVNDFRFITRSAWPPAALPHRRGLLRWFAVFGAMTVILGLSGALQG